MRKLDNFLRSLNLLKSANFVEAKKNEIYRMGVIVIFDRTFELAWKALQETLRSHGVKQADTGSPKEILQLGYKVGFLTSSDEWALMLKKRNLAAHVYDVDFIDELLTDIKDKFIPAFDVLACILKEKIIEY